MKSRAKSKRKRKRKRRIRSTTPLSYPILPSTALPSAHSIKTKIKIDSATSWVGKIGWKRGGDAIYLFGYIFVMGWDGVGWDGPAAR